MDEDYLKHLIKKYINGTATTDERYELLSWYRGSEDEFTLPYENAEQEEEAKEKMLSMLMQHIAKPQIRRINTSLFLKIAAAAILFIGTCLFIYKTMPGKQPQTVAAIIYNTVTTKRGERKIVTLTDGSVIYLSAGSSVQYPSAFNGATREITFAGEAFFEIAKDKRHPFIVHTGKTSTRVLGTTFNITDRDNQPDITVALITGKVAFSDGKSKSTLLPGHLVAYTKLTGTLKVKRIPDVEAVTSRRDGNYEYQNVKVATIAEDLNLNFDAGITLSGKVKNCQFFGRMKQGESVGDFLQKLAIVENAKLIKLKDGYLIKGGGCN